MVRGFKSLSRYHGARWSNGYLTWPSTRRLPVQIRHASPWPHRLLARIRPLQGREDGSEPSGATVWGYGAVVPALPISRGLMAGQRTVNPSVEVRLLPREPWVLAQVVRAPGRQLGGHGFKSAPVVKRTSRLTTNQETGGSSPSGSAQARLAQWEGTWSTTRGRRSDSFAEHGGRTEWRGAGR